MTHRAHNTLPNSIANADASSDLQAMWKVSIVSLVHVDSFFPRNKFELHSMLCISRFV